MKATDVITALQAAANPEKAAFFPRFFKTGPGQYGEGDVFLGITVPSVRAIAKAYRALPLTEVAKLLADPMHEVRVSGLEILVDRYEHGTEAAKADIVEFYLSHLKGVNNWDLVDGSAPYILGDWLLTHDRSVLYTFAASGELWKQRIAIVATYAFIRTHQFGDTLKLAEIFLTHSHDLMHKAVGWMLREVGKRDQAVLERFLGVYAKTMPRTMLRYAIEKFAPADRARFMARS